MSVGLACDAPAKLNLYLHLLGRRDDGYHELDSLVAFLALGDRLLVRPADRVAIDVIGPLAAGVPTDAGNLVLRAAVALAAEVGGGGAAIVLEKHLPAAAGLGGGSADAAAALRCLCRLWGRSPDPDTLAAIALRLGADVPACLLGRPARMQGIGERLTPVAALPTCGVVLANPAVPLATAEVFRAWRGGFSPVVEMPTRFTGPAALVDFLTSCRNDLESAAIDLAPAVADTLAWLRALPRARLARMAGSGATCFALFDDAAAARAAVAGAAVPPGWWVRPTAISARD